MIVVVNKKDYKGHLVGLGIDPVDIAFSKGHYYAEYIGRSNGGSLLQNNFIIGRDGTREVVIEKAGIFIEWRMESDPRFYNYMEALAAIHKHGAILLLICHCKPLACHGDKAKEILEAM
ncbi:hypothetical protein LCGC14_2311030 [marine sediment metagenome]|uniref:DUF4326 domain-containing protein n=1 Tax=marine sediment metagenome TaxID=412755 RepID=A0A0F9CKP7_9ZZZZ